MSSKEDNPKGITQADVIVGIPSCNEASSISFPTQQADKGLVKYYSDMTSAIINCDNNSPDNTRQAFMNTATETPKIYLPTDDGVKGKGNNLLKLFAKAVELSAKAILVVDADVTSITPLWIHNLSEPLFEDYQFVAPLYVRHKYDGPFTSNLIYPLTRALYGRRVRQPIGGDVAFSGEVARMYLESEFWDEAVGDFGINIWMTTTAIRNKVPVIQSFMGRPRIHHVRDTPNEMESMFKDVAGTLFELMCRFDTFWKAVKWSRPTAVFGFGAGDVEVAPPVEVDTTLLWNKMSEGLQTYWDFYGEFLNNENRHKLEEVTDLPQECFEFPTALWAKIVYDFGTAYKNQVASRDQLLDSLLPLFYAKTLSFVLETKDMNTQQVEEFIEDQCLQFEKTKPYLLDRWFAG
jgi:glycosyltransferase involved in cell wall biosynthesis